MEETKLTGLDQDCPPILPVGWDGETLLPETGAVDETERAEGAESAEEPAQAETGRTENAPETEESANALTADAIAAQVKELKERYPDLQTLPTEAVEAAMAGVPLAEAYREIRERELRQSVETLQKENRILRQRERTAARSPVTGVGSGGQERMLSDFERGFDAGLHW